MRNTCSCGDDRAPITTRSGIAVAVEVEHRERSAILIEIQADAARHFVEAAMAVVVQQHVALVLRLRAIAHQQPVRRAPPIVVLRPRLARQRRCGDDVTPEQAVHIDGRLVIVSREHAVDDQEIREAVVIDIERIGGPGPAAELRVCVECDIGKRPIAIVVEQRIAARVTAIADRGCRPAPRA